MASAVLCSTRPRAILADNHASTRSEGRDIREYTAIEIGILKDIGYTLIVPEPSTAILGAIGVVGLCCGRTRKRKQGSGSL